MSTNPQNSSNPNQRSVALATLFPEAAVVFERRIAGEPAELEAVEAHYVSRARPKRLQEFAAGRACARAALAHLGMPRATLPAAEDRQPIWPPGFVGSITHTTGFCAAVAARRSAVLALGLDSEIVGAPTVDIWPTICRAEEQAWIDTLPETERGAAVTLMFSAKEAFYKCQYPLVAEWLDFHDLLVAVPEWGAGGGRFVVVGTRAIRFAGHAVLPITGHYVFHEQFVSAGVAVSADQ